MTGEIYGRRRTGSRMNIARINTSFLTVAVALDCLSFEMIPITLLG